MSTQALSGLEAKYRFQIWVKFTYFKSNNDVLSVPSELERDGPVPGAVIRMEFHQTSKQA